MAKAGLFIPMGGGGPGGNRTYSSSESCPPSTACRMLWFDQVLADIGDAQSLQQNLSTFSGHIRRIKAILAAATGRSLVLLDEVRRADRVILLFNGR